MINFKPKYNCSWALVIGINKYPTSPLDFARQDAEAVEQILIEQFSFPKENIISLYDEDATKDNITKSYLSFIDKIEDENDRLMVFFAGHGETYQTAKRDTGYLVPVDANESISSYIRWDEFTRNADLIKAKHILYIMDACYSGTAINRKISSGSMRYIKDMLSRYSRQVITAGKADEPVADANGPIKGHSIFTGYLIKALKGEAKAQDGSLTANNVMAYVYENVSKDDYSDQTPHFGYLDGDGDFIFESPILEVENDTEPEYEDKDYLIEYPYGDTVNDRDDICELAKTYISDKQIIKLDDLAIAELKSCLSKLRTASFLLNGAYTPEEFQKQISFYEEVFNQLIKVVTIISYWGGEAENKIVEKVLARVAEENQPESGNSTKLAMRWYPCILLSYCSGIGCVYSEKYSILNNFMNLEVEYNQRSTPLFKLLSEQYLEFVRRKIFQVLPSYERHLVPRSEYLHSYFQIIMDDLLFMGKSYEKYFDLYEIMFALNYMHKIDDAWAPIGRFSWKYRHNNFMTKMIQESETQKAFWKPIEGGFFDNSVTVFQKTAISLEEFMQKLKFR